MENPIVDLAELCQKKFRKNIETRVVNIQGADHCPMVTCEIELPDGQIFQGNGGNQKLAKRRAAEKALDALNA